MSFPRGQAAIVGAATAGMGESPGTQPIELAVAAAGDALKQAGLTFADVDAVFGASSSNPFYGLQMAEYLGIQPKLTNNSRRPTEKPAQTIKELTKTPKQNK